jgi:glucan phosphoethanolaminetransferase (alkaline phosphatase superfamily)
MYDIPFLIWLSPEYRERNQEFVDTLPAGRERFGKMDDSFGYSLAELSRIGFSKFRPERSIFSKGYQEPDGVLGNGIDYFSLPY